MCEDIENSGGSEDIHIEDYDKRRHRVKTMECEDIVVSQFPFLFIESQDHHTVKWGPSEQSQMTDVMLNQNSMSSSEDNESKSYPKLDESALLAAQVKLSCVFEI